MLKEKHIRADSLKDTELEKWMLKIRGWILENGQKLTLQGVSVYGKEKTTPAALLTYFRKIYSFIEEEDQRDELEKDIWELDKLDILIRTNPIKNFQTLNFTAIIQKDLREEVKKAVYEHLHHESLATITKELTAVRMLSRYLAENIKTSTQQKN